MDAPHLIPDDSFQPIQGEPAPLLFSHPHGDKCELTFHTSSGVINTRINRRHWDWVQANALNHACLVCDFKLTETGPTHLIWSFPPGQEGDYKHWTYLHNSSEISESLTQSILESELGQCCVGRGARFGFI